MSSKLLLLFTLLFALDFIYCISHDFIVVMETDPLVIEASKPANITFSIKDMHNNPVKWDQLQVDSGRKLHIVFVGYDLDILGHIHPEDFMDINSAIELGKYTVSFTFPKAGLYAIAIEFMPLMDQAYGNLKVQKQFNLTVVGSPQMNTQIFYDFSSSTVIKSYQLGINESFIRPILLSEISRVNNISNAIRVNLGHISEAMDEHRNEFIAGQCVQILFTFNNANNNESILNLTPYLEHAMHAIIVREGLDFVEHIHGMAVVDHMMNMFDCNETNSMMPTPSQFGPQLKISYIFPKPGIYRIFIQTTRQNYQMLIPAFMIDIQPQSLQPIQSLQPTLPTQPSNDTCYFSLSHRILLLIFVVLCMIV